MRLKILFWSLILPLHFLTKMVFASLCVADSPKQQHFHAHILNNQQSIFINLSKNKDIGKNRRDICNNSKEFALNN